ncbi:MAG: zinc ribbon domain-containing protein [Methanobacterium sp.]|nr:zinc ribbon domain-containing protein [Methanobacterium sp.]
MVICKNCGYRNDDEAQFCQNCGESLKPKEGMSNITMILIVVVIVLALIVGLFAAMYLTQNQTTPTNNTTIIVNQSKPNASADWHQISNFNGANNANTSFTIRGKQFKVVISATPKNISTNRYMTVNITNGNTILSTGTLSWGSNDQTTKAEKTLQVTANPGTYYLFIYTKDLLGWNITIYDYY